MMFSMTNTSPTGRRMASAIKGLDILETFEVIFKNAAISLSSAKTGMKQMYLNPYIYMNLLSSLLIFSKHPS